MSSILEQKTNLYRVMAQHNRTIDNNSLIVFKHFPKVLGRYCFILKYLLTVVSRENAYDKVLSDAQDSIFTGCKRTSLGLTLPP